MNCNPAPENNCGSLLPDTCIPVTIAWPECFGGTNNCPRQSEWNKASSDLICCLNLTTLSLYESINGVERVGTVCDAQDPFIPFTGCEFVIPANAGTDGVLSVHTEIQTIYDKLCALQTNLSIPLSGLDTGCLIDPCGDPIGTLGALLQALINKQCANGIYRANLTQTSTAAPVVTVLENSIGVIVWTRTGIGIYVGTLAGAFTADKTFLVIQNTPGTSTTITRTNVNQVTITSTTDTDLLETSVEIRIYP